MVLDEELAKCKKLYKSFLQLKHQRKKIFIECFLYINNRKEYKKSSNCMLILVIFKLTDDFRRGCLLARGIYKREGVHWRK